MTKKLIGDLGQELYWVSCKGQCDFRTWAMCVNAIVKVLDQHGKDFRLFLQAAGANDDEQAKGRVTF